MSTAPNSFRSRYPYHQHYIEEIAKVYLRLNAAGDGWEIDTITLDGYPLFGYDGGPQVNHGECGEREDEDHDEVECERVLRATQRLDLPDAETLFNLLGRALEKPGF